MNHPLATMLAHRSIRSYLDKPVEEHKLNLVIQAIQAAPNWVNLQLVSIISVKNSKRRETLSRLCGNQPSISQAPVFLVFCADYYRIRLALEKKKQHLDKVLEDIDTLITGVHEVGIAVGTATAAAEALGLGTVVIGDIRKNPHDVIRMLNLPLHVMPILGFCMGYAAEDPGMKPRLPRAAVYFEEQYHHNLVSCLDEYDVAYCEYLKKRPWNNRVGNWTDLAADFYKIPYHYEQVAEALKAQQFFTGKTRNNTRAIK